MTIMEVEELVVVLKKCERLVRASRKMLIDVGVVFPGGRNLAVDIKRGWMLLSQEIREYGEDESRPLLKS